MTLSAISEVLAVEDGATPTTDYAVTDPNTSFHIELLCFYVIPF